ncbi:MAG: DUF1467 domain-containing protein [Mesorhizobium amorphae]|nr:MAG: DUF1467 domain-containing protein [Mesorhizobium amorphae]
MGWLTFLALSFIVWWLVLFAALPFSLRTQDDDNDVTLGTVSSAPRGPHVRRAMLRTTIATALIMGALYYAVNSLGFGISSIPRLVPDFTQN